MNDTRAPIRIAQVMGKMNSGGVESFVMNYYRKMDKDKIQFDFIVDEDSELPQKEEIEKLGGNIIRVPSYQHIFKYMNRLIKIFNENNYEIVHSHLNSLSVFPLCCAYIAKVPYRIAHSHSTSNRKEKIKNILKNILKPFSKIFATNYFACSEHAGRWLFGDKTFDFGKVNIVHNAIDVDRFKFNEEIRKKVRKDLNLEGKFVIGHVGRFVTQKNHEFLIDIFNEVCKEKEESVLLLIGEGPLENKIRDKVKSLKLEKKVYFLNVRNDVNELMQAMDIFVFPSLYEGLGIVAIEAQCSGLKCICSTEVPNEVKVSNAIDFIELNNITEWKYKILNADIHRIDCSNLLRKFGYDLENEVIEIFNIYREMGKSKF